MRWGFKSSSFIGIRFTQSSYRSDLFAKRLFAICTVCRLIGWNETRLHEVGVTNLLDHIMYHLIKSIAVSFGKPHLDGITSSSFGRAKTKSKPLGLWGYENMHIQNSKHYHSASQMAATPCPRWVGYLESTGIQLDWKSQSFIFLMGRCCRLSFAFYMYLYSEYLLGFYWHRPSSDRWFEFFGWKLNNIAAQHQSPYHGDDASRHPVCVFIGRWLHHRSVVDNRTKTSPPPSCVLLVVVVLWKCFAVRSTIRKYERASAIWWSLCGSSPDALQRNHITYSGINRCAMVDGKATL